ncbi:MAG: glycosyltransferase [Candidatus Helarchaeota archaeon]
MFFIIPEMVSGGTELKVTILLKYFRQRNYALTLVLFKKSGVQLNKVPKDIRIIDLKKRGRLDFVKLIFKLGKLLKKERPDKIVSFLFYANVISALARKLYRFDSDIIINEESFPREYLSRARLGFVKKWLLHFTYREADKIICVSKNLGKSIIDDFNFLSTRKVFIVYNPIDLKNVKKLSLEKVNHPFIDRRKKGYYLIISVGRLSFEKRLDILLKAFAKVRKRAKVLLLILGDGDQFQKLKLLTNQLGLDDTVDFLGYISNPYAWISKSDLFVMTSQWEGFGMVIVEAMACGVPIISTNCPFGPNEIITNSVDGLLVPSGNIEIISKSILMLIKNKNLKKKIVINAKKRSNNFRIEKIGSEYEKVIKI